MADTKKVLIVTQEMNPYVALTEIAKIARELPKYIQDKGMEIRILMPKFGIINERRHRLHEVVRLSGINIIIAEDDYPLIIKVASLPGARMQVYFLDNDDFFNRKAVFSDNQNRFFQDNTERMIFFCKGVIETVKKFGWSPDIVHCHGWMTSLIPLYLRTAYKNEPVFQNAKIVYSLYGSSFDQPISKDFLKKAPLIQKHIEKDALKFFKNGNNEGLDLGALEYSDAIVIGSKEVNGDVKKQLNKTSKPVVEYNADRDDYLEAYRRLYEDLSPLN